MEQATTDTLTLPSRFAAPLVGMVGMEAQADHVFEHIDQLRSELRSLGFDDPERDDFPAAARHLFVERERANDADRNAVVVVDSIGRRYGYIPAAIARRLAPEIDAGIPWVISSYHVRTSSRRPDQPGITVRVAAIEL